jgi:drug/metabolite transporter (DMT)-like permease
MNNWFFIALISPVLLSFVNHLDKYMLSKYSKDRGVGALLILSAISSILVLPFIFYFHFNIIFNVPLLEILILVLAGFISAGAFYFYLLAMDLEETSIVIPLFQLIPVFGYFLGFMVLGESLNTPQILSSLLIMLGITFLTLEIDEERKLKLKFKVLLLVGLSSFCYALQDVLFKKVALVGDFWSSVFWEYTSLVFAGFLIFIFVKKFRLAFLDLFKTSGRTIISLNIGAEILYIIANITNSFALLLAPVVLVFVVSSYQPLFVFILGVLLTLILPHITQEKISNKHLLHKLISIIIIIIGSYFLYTTSTY